MEAAARWSRNRPRVGYDVMGEYGWVLNEDRPAALPFPRSGPFKINWLVPGITGAVGGYLNIFRTIQLMERWGHQHRIYVTGTVAEPSELTRMVRESYWPIEGELEVFSGRVAEADALVATHWSTAYFARTLDNTSKKFYFVQDLEHLFYPKGSLHEFAKQTYKFGFCGITLGQWIADSLSSEFGMECAPFGFSYDREFYYPPASQNGSVERKRVLFYARPSTERRGFELGILALALVARERPETEFILIGAPSETVELPFAASVPGTLSPSELGSLYRNCTVALVLSHTNPSMLPLELMACGCAVVSNRGENVESLLTEQSTQLASPTPRALADAILQLLNNERLREQKVAAGFALAESTDWNYEVKKIEAAFYRGFGLVPA